MLLEVAFITLDTSGGVKCLEEKDLVEEPEIKELHRLPSELFVSCPQFV